MLYLTLCSQGRTDCKHSHKWLFEPQQLQDDWVQDAQEGWEGKLESQNSGLVENRLKLIQGIARQNPLANVHEDEGSLGDLAEVLGQLIDGWSLCSGRSKCLAKQNYFV